MYATGGVVSKLCGYRGGEIMQNTASFWRKWFTNLSFISIWYRQYYVMLVVLQTLNSALLASSSKRNDPCSVDLWKARAVAHPAGPPPTMTTGRCIRYWKRLLNSHTPSYTLSISIAGIFSMNIGSWEFLDACTCECYRTYSYSPLGINSSSLAFVLLVVNKLVLI